MRLDCLPLVVAATLFGIVMAEGQTGTPAAKERTAMGGSSLVGRPPSRTGAPVKRTTPPGPPALTLVGATVTASSAQSFALNGTLAYVCDVNEVSVVDISNPATPKVVATSTAGNFINNSALTYCNVERGTLVVFSDQSSSTIGNSPGFVAFSLDNPLQPSLIKATPINRRFFAQILYSGNYAFIPTFAITTFFFSWDNQFGDLLAIDVSNFNTPALAGTLEQPQIDSSLGGATGVFGITQASANLVYIGGSTSTGAANNGTGRLQTVDISNPTAMQIVSQLLIPGTIQFSAPLIQGTVAVGLGNTGGYQPGTANRTGNVVVATFDVSNQRAPALLSSTQTTYSVGPGAGAVQIGANLFAFAGVQDASGNPVLLTVNIANPSAPVIQSIPTPMPFNSMQVIGNTLYATLGTGGFGIYSIPGITSASSVCPAFLDAMVVLDQGAAFTSAAFSDAKNALTSFVGDLQLTADQAGVASFTSSATVEQTLTHNAAQADAALGGISQAAPGSYIGSGIIAAQAELTSPRHNPLATPVIVIVSDGADSAAPNSSATLAAANAAKAAGIRIISVQYGSGGTLMQSIASSSSDYHQVSQ